MDQHWDNLGLGAFCVAVFATHMSWPKQIDRRRHRLRGHRENCYCLGAPFEMKFHDKAKMNMAKSSGQEKKKKKRNAISR